MGVPLARVWSIECAAADGQQANERGETERREEGEQGRLDEAPGRRARQQEDADGEQG